MNYQEARAYLKEKETLGSVYGLASIRCLLKQLHQPQESYEIIHVAGTNGKGSTISFVSTVLKTAGYRVGRYHSPAVFGYEEKIQVDNQWITKEAVAKMMTLVRKAAEEMVEKGYAHPTVFEMETAMAFLYFKEQGCQIVCVETGMGGRLDATNIITAPACVAFSSISLDHLGILGNSMEEIAKEKAGIIKKNTTVVTTCQKAGVETVLIEKAVESGCPLVVADAGRAKILKNSLEGQVFSYKEYDEVEIKLLGKHQVENAVLAIEILRVMQKKEYHISKKDMITGLKNTHWKGRFSQIGRNPLFFVDGAHNEQAALRLREAINFYFTNRKLCYIMGMLKDKEYKKITELMAPLAKDIITITPTGPRGLSGQVLAKEAEKYCSRVTVAEDLKEAVKLAKDIAGEEGVILAFGSLSFLEQLEVVMEIE